MLKIEEFQQAQRGTVSFNFKELKLINQSSQKLVYTDSKGQCFSFVQYDSFEEVKIIDTLARRGLFFNYVGSLKRLGKYFAFYSVGEFMDLQKFSQGLIARNERVDEKFCIQYFDSFIYILGEVQRFGIHIKFLSPSSIGLRNPLNNQSIGFGLLLPTTCKYFNCILKSEYEQNVKYAAPEIIRYFTFNSYEEICPKEFKKSCFYSIGICLLICFGFSFTVKQRIQASRNDRDFKAIFKKIRKQIKVIHSGKYVPKVLKLLLEDCEKSRETLETLVIKIRSKQFESLKISKSLAQSIEKFVSTIGDTDKSQGCKTNKTITIEINSYSSPITLTPTSNVGSAFKNSDRQSQKSQNGEIIDVSSLRNNVEVTIFEQEKEKRIELQDLNNKNRQGEKFHEQSIMQLNVDNEQNRNEIKPQKNQFLTYQNSFSVLSPKQLLIDEQTKQRRVFQCKSKILIVLTVLFSLVFLIIDIFYGQ